MCGGRCFPGDGKAGTCPMWDSEFAEDVSTEHDHGVGLGLTHAQRSANITGLILSFSVSV